MAKINILPSKVYNRIAAGEVIERPFSVVKELVENSIDAGATEIEIFVENGGKQLIKVIDNGCGIAREDLPSAFLPHATSKIAQAEDLDSVLTLGFRGEAIASIASISDMSITSKTTDGQCYRLNCFGGEIGQVEEVASGRVGTEVSVESLFLNTPVRLKFLKTDKGEETEITNLVSRFILNRSDIAFTYYADGKQILQSFGDGMEAALVSVYGANTLRDCYHIDAEKHGIHIYGYIGNQNFYKANKSYQSIFLNGRYILNGTIASAISSAYASYLMKRQYPFYVLHIDVPREIVDVNVHPNKADVRFADNQIIFRCIHSVISAVLDGQTKALEYIVDSANEDSVTQEALPMPKAEESMQGLGAGAFDYETAKKEMEKYAVKIPVEREVKKTEPPQVRQKGFIPASELGNYVPTGEKHVITPATLKNTRAAEELHERFPDLYFERTEYVFNEKQDERQIDVFELNKRYLAERAYEQGEGELDLSYCKYVGKLFNTYIMYEYFEDIYIIDQHAAHERLIYDRLKARLEKREILRQPMLYPFRMQMNYFEGDFIRERMQDIVDIGFTIEERDENEFFVTEVPVDLIDIDVKRFLHGILADIKEYRSIKLDELIKDKLAAEACRAAVKGGMDLSEEEIKALFTQMRGNMGLKCPHGRPVVAKMTRKQLEKLFKRIV